jgi:hypothetical protein
MRPTNPRAALERQTQPRHRPEYLATSPVPMATARPVSER